MKSAAYRIVPFEDGWGVAHDGEISGPYETKEAAFEAAVMAAALAMREGHEVHLSVPSREALTGTTTGIAARG